MSKRNKPKWKRQALVVDKELGQKVKHTKDKDFNLVNNQKIFVAHRDFPTFCGVCFRDILKDQSYVIENKLMIHFKCYKFK